MAENPNFHLEGIVRERDSLQDFEGPLSLILLLLQKNKIEIRDLRISDILDQYLTYLERMQQMDLEIASEFVQMASHLLYLKTRTLLTAEEEISELELLMQSLEQLQAQDRFAALQMVLPELKTASESGLRYFAKLPEPIQKTQEAYAYRHEPVDLLKAMLDVWTRSGAQIPVDEQRIFSAVPRQIPYSVRSKGRELLEKLQTGPQTLNGIYRECRSGTELVATFLAVLELCSQGSIRLERAEDQIVLHFMGDGAETDRILEEIEDER